MDFLLSALPGLAIALALYFVYLVATKGLPSAIAWVKTKWTAGKAQIQKIEDDLDHAYERIAVLEKQVVSLLGKAAPAAQGTASQVPASDPSPIFLQPKPEAAAAAAPAAQA